MNNPVSKALALGLHFIAYIPLAGVTLSIFMEIKILILQGIALVRDGGWTWIGLHQSMDLDFLQLLLDEHLSPVRHTLIPVAAKLANTPALWVFPCTALIFLALGKGIQRLAQRLE